MKAWMLVLSLAAVLGFSGLADAKGTEHGGIKGIITAVNGATFTMTTRASKKKNSTATGGLTYTVNAATATITGGTLAVGQKVLVVGTQNVAPANGGAVTTITASMIKIVTKHGKKKSTT